MKNTIESRGAKTARERMVAALNSSDNDIYESDGRLIVTGTLPKNLGGDRIYLGEVSMSAMCQKGTSPIELLDYIRFGYHFAPKEPV